MTIINTHSVVKNLIAHGWTENQAEVMTDLFSQCATKDQLDEIKQTMVTKAELMEVKTNLKAEIMEVKAEIMEVRTEIIKIENKITDIKLDLLKWTMPMFMTTIGLMVSILIKMTYG
ncbi:coiled-coil domain-containing protein [Candidatus Trichorickettsia mobilis]|uniref:coiled-coil domain-containing protein n=1 Tax=Candidatus Trichorickettsia mobilis TaxID=1346319 RepID=UPI002930E05B|nr:coiled-coil domain-containing protein [Candidatus Trichorickettsia mobilis]